MTQVILKQAKIIDASSPFHNQVMDIKIENGTITQIEKEIALVEANKELIKIYEQKIKDKISRVWSK